MGKIAEAGIPGRIELEGQLEGCQLVLHLQVEFMLLPAQFQHEEGVVEFAHEMRHWSLEAMEGWQTSIPSKIITLGRDKKALRASQWIS